jgi:hypothetical protein
MSRSYSIRIPVEVLLPKGAGMNEGTFSLIFTMLEILPVTRMRELLKAQLLEKGFNETADGLEMPCPGQAKAVLDLVSMTMKLSVPMPNSTSVLVEEEYLAEFQEALKNAIENGKVINNWQIENRIDQLKQQVVNQLKNLAVEARKEVNASLKEVYREAVREKAASIGNVENVTESREGNTYRIRIEIST